MPGTKVKQGVDRLFQLLDIVIVALMAAMIGLVFVNVVMRYGFSTGFRESIELSRLGFVWIVMLGAVVVLRRDQHLAITEIAHALFPKAVLPWLDRIKWSVVLISVVLLGWGAQQQTVANWNNISQLTGLPKGALYLPGAIAGAMMFCIALSRLIWPQRHEPDA